MDTGMGAKAEIFKGNRVLVLYKPNGRLDFGGGRLENGETHKEALVREIWEETGLLVQIKNPICDWQFFKKNGHLITGTTYRCNWLKGEVRLSPEHVSYSWLDPKSINLPDLNRWLSPHNLRESYVRGVR